MFSNFQLQKKIKVVQNTYHDKDNGCSKRIIISGNLDNQGDIRVGEDKHKISEVEFSLIMVTGESGQCDIEKYYGYLLFTEGDSPPLISGGIFFDAEIFNQYWEIFLKNKRLSSLEMVVVDEPDYRKSSNYNFHWLDTQKLYIESVSFNFSDGWVNL